ncbi:MAG TPA: hypothetical protein VGN09_20700 [Vicinamibacteria bacterium]
MIPLRLAIALLSALILFLEMLLIRWLGTEVRIFAYLQNGVLVAAFLGLGLGCRDARSPARLLPAIACLVLIALVIRDPFGWGVKEAITQGLVAAQDSVIWGRRFSEGGAGTGTARLLFVAFSVAATLVLLWAVARAFQPLGQRLGRWMDQEPRPIAGYSANLLGSLAGIALFDALTVARTPPLAWLAVAGAGLAAFALRADDGRRGRIAAMAGALALPLAAWSPAPGTVVWSPYQKLAREPLRPGGAGGPSCGELINVNNTLYQALVDLDPVRMAASPELYPPSEVRFSHYILPYEIVGPRQRVLIVGAGAGNDAAAAVRAGAGAVRAVEIDPVIADWGRDRHPNAPYRDGRVQVTIDDARAFFRRDRGRYDLVWFGLLDSHTNPSAYTNVRLDHFVYTRESLADVKALLAPSGVIVLFFQPETLWIADRLVGLVKEAFGAMPLVAYVKSSTPCLGYGGLMLIGGDGAQVESMRRRAAADEQIRSRLIPPETWALKTRLTTDDWPYLYLPRPTVPRYHVLVALACLVLTAVLSWRFRRRGEGIDVSMVLLGAGFMLLEVSSVSRAALLYGTTWTVNAYVVGAILSMALLANLVASRLTIHPAGWPAVGLALSLLALALVPTVWLASLPIATRVVVGGAFLALPVFFSGLLFVSLWAASPRRDLALGSNLLGSLLGGLASMLSMAVGFRALVFLTLATYLAVTLRALRARGAGSAAAG